MQECFLEQMQYVTLVSLEDGTRRKSIHRITPRSCMSIVSVRGLLKPLKTNTSMLRAGARGWGVVVQDFYVDAQGWGVVSKLINNDDFFSWQTMAKLSETCGVRSKLQ